MQHGPDLDLTAVILCRDDEERIGHQVRRVSEYMTSLRLRGEIIVVDEFSADNSLPLLSLLRKQVPQLKVVAGVSPGRGFIRGAELARGRAILLLDGRCDAPLSGLGFALGRLHDGWDAAAVHGRYLVLRRARTFEAFSSLSHRRDPLEVEDRFLRRAHSLGLRVERAGQKPTQQTTWNRIRDAVLVPLASRAWF